MVANRRGRSKLTEHGDTMGTNVYSSKDSKSMHKSLNSEFILYQVLLQRILDGEDSLPITESSLLKYFEPDEKADKETMTEFDSSYQSPKAIHWYTRESCIYRILNKALRTQNIDDITPFGPFMRDLNTQLSVEHQSFIKEQAVVPLKIYRGQLISKDEVKRLKGNEGNLISMNSFLSTSTNREKALEFATSKPPPTDELTSILLEISIYFDGHTKPYADIKHLSAFSKEEEILFMFGCMFRIDQISYDEQKKLWMAKLTLCSEDDPDVKDFLASTDKELQGQNPFISLGNSLIGMRKFDDAEEHFKKVLELNLAKNDIELAYCHHGLGTVHEKKGNHSLSIKEFKRALDYLLKNPLTNDHPLISQCYNDLGSMYSNQNKYELAFGYFEKALDTKNNLPSITYFNLSQVHFKMTNYNLALAYLQQSLDSQVEKLDSFDAHIYIHMGQVYTAMNQKEKASKQFDQAMESQLNGLPPGHPDIGSTYNANGLMYSDIGDETKAFEMVEKAFQLQSEILPNQHPDFGETYKNFAYLYMKRGDLDRAILSYEKLLENQLKSLSRSHPSVAETYQSIASAHWKNRNYEQASIYSLKLLDSESERKTFGQPTIIAAYKNLGDLYLDKYNVEFDKESLDHALVFYLKQLENELQTKLKEDFSLITIYELIAEVSFRKRHLDQALLYYNRLLDCHYRRLPLDQSIIDRIYTSIGKVYSKKHHFDQTLLYYQKLQINQSKNVSTNVEHQNIDDSHFEKRHLDQASNYFQNFLEKQLEIYSKKDPLINNTYYILANISFEQGNITQALNYFLHVLNNDLTNKPLHDPSLENIYKAIATMYFQEHNYSESLVYFNRLLDCQLEKRKMKHPSISDTYTMIGKIYLKKDHSHHITNYLNKSIQHELDSTVSENKTHSYMTNYQFEKQHLDQALLYFQQSLQSETSNHSIDEIYTILGNISLEGQGFKEALT